MPTDNDHAIHRWTRQICLDNNTVNAADNAGNKPEATTRVTIRPIEHRDVILEQEFIRHLSDVARRRLSPEGRTHFTTEELLELCSVDYRNSMAFVATTVSGGKTREIGIARYSRDCDRAVHEAAVVVAREYVDTLLTACLLESLIWYAREHGVLILKVIDFYTNTTLKMLAMELGMTPSADDHDPHRVIYTLSLSTVVNENEDEVKDEAENR